MRYLGVVSFCLLLASCGGSGGTSNGASQEGGDTAGKSGNAPEFVSLSSASVSEGQALSLDAQATDKDNDTLSYFISGTDASIFNISQEGLITFNTNASYEVGQIFSITVNVTDGSYTTTKNINISVTAEITSDLSLFSAAFKDTGSAYYNIPLKYTCDSSDGGISPTLSWSGVPPSTTSLVLTMHSINTDDSIKPHFSIFNIPASINTLPAGDFSIGTQALGDMSESEILAANGIPYTAPCAVGAGSETFYTFTLSALSRDIELTSSATQSQINLEIEQGGNLLSSKSLITRRVRWDAASLANDLHVPTKVPSTCAEKLPHFNAYSANNAEVVCSDEDNYIGVKALSTRGVRTTEPDQQNQVGITYWIGRISLPGQNVKYTQLTPSFLNEASNNVPCDGDGSSRVGLTVDGLMMLPFFNQNIGSEGEKCGPLEDGKRYDIADIPLVGGVDQCFGHAGNGDGYHLHGMPICLMDVHDPSQPIAYALDGIPVYFGQGGGTLEGTPHASTTSKRVTATNYGAGHYEHLDYRPSDVIDGTNPLNECNAYDINGDGATSGYVYYTTKEAPYSIGCFMGEVFDLEGTPALGGQVQTKLLSERGWREWLEGYTNIEGSIQANYVGEFLGKTYEIYDIYIDDDRLTLLTKGNTAQVLWRLLNTSDDLYEPGTDCFEFRYRLNKDVTDNDRVETICASTVLPQETLDLTPFGSD